jgi:hypothetical protein
MQRSNVVLPQPEAPSRKNNSPGSIWTEIPSRARVLPKDLTTDWARMDSMRIDSPMLSFQASEASSKQIKCAK